MKSRDLAIAGILLAIGAILRYLSNIIPGAIVANPIIALYCLAIILIAPKVKDALGIGIVAGIMSALISHSIFPPANLISEPLGALVCLVVFTALRGRIPLAPGIATFIATLASGFTFLLVSLAVIVASVVTPPGEHFTIEAFIIGVSPIIILTAIANAVIAQVLSFPASRILMRGAAGENGAASAPLPGMRPEEGASDAGDAITFDNFSYTYPRGDTPALSGITLTIPRGQCVLINGATGAGKTTFCLAAAGILNHEYEGITGGSITLFGKKAAEYRDMGEIGRTVGVVFDDADAQLIFTTVEEEVLSGLENRGMESSDVKQRLEAILQLTDIAHLRYRPPHTLSGGQKQRVSLAATLASGTECLILDEATAELDETATETIIGILARLKADGKTILVVEQKPEELAGIADRVILLEKGRLTGVYAADDYFSEFGREDAEEAPGPAPGPCPPAGPPVISVRDLVHAYGETRALDGISLDIGAGELLAIIGENGSGKTTLVKHFNGLLHPTSGTVRVCGTDTAGATVTELARHVGLVFQNPDTMLFEDTVEREILFGLKNIGKEADADDAITDVLDEVGLLNRKGSFPRAMSRGERQRLAIACVTAMHPEVIVLDEPTTGLDSVEAVRIMGILERLADAGHTVIMVSHDRRIVQNHARRIIKMEQGKITLDSGCTGGGA
ncbi:MAG: ATP-binding cassette domain-containing protein [Methanomicrobiaceae archaeon]|nr:ATP-binding cassette domain-containing protein [Methanomicrobiaceae archaeon]